MTMFARDEDRRLVPRWRFLSDRVASAELGGDPRVSRHPTYDPTYLAQRLADWAHAPSLGTAADLVTGALATGMRDQGIAAAEYLLQRRECIAQAVARIAEQCLEDAVNTRAETGTQRALLLTPDLRARTRATIHATRERTNRNARNAEAWLDMSRAYAIVGQKELAGRAMDRALLVAPSHRTVLRAATRLYVHLHDPERAARLLADHPRTRLDPWLLASEIAIASIVDRSSKHMRTAHRLASSASLPAAHLAELQSALATTEFYRGDLRQARRYARDSLVAPNDNCAAQARWLAVRIPQIVVTEAAFDLAQSFEARCWRALRAGNWTAALAEAHLWLLDEPFSSRPAIIGSFIGVTLTEDYAFGADCARIGIQADPSNRTLRNNLVVALAYIGALDEAERHYKLISRRFDDEFPEYVYAATEGLLRFRARDDVAGRAHYQRAMRLAPDSIRIRVLAYWLREELHHSPDSSQTVLALCEKAIAMSKKDPFTARLAQLVRSRAEQVSSISRQMSESDQVSRTLLEASRLGLIGPSNHD